MRTLPDDFDPATVAALDERLDQVEVGHEVAVPWAVESGSRAWGFPSPDSDYDCRFFYVRPVRDYLDPWPPRDVIETPLDGVLDANGWDLRKAVQLAVAGNATVGEWLRSPWIYRGDEAFRDDLLGLVEEVLDPVLLRRHYVHVALAQWGGATAGTDVVRLKKVFYAVRPALTVQWMDDNAGIPPMNLDDLLAGTSVPDDVVAEIVDLRAEKARTRELGEAPVPPAIATWLESCFRREADRTDEARPPRRARAAEGFRRLLDRWAPDSEV